MKSASLLIVLLVAKIAMVWGHAAPLSGWSVIAYAWQDVAIALAFFVIEFGLKRIASIVYWAVVAYAAINIPVARAVSSPLTPPMLRAARGPLADSMMLYVTPVNFALVLLVIAIAFVRVPRRVQIAMVILAIPVVVLGPIASSRVDTRGMDRNAITALIGSELPRVATTPATSVATDWRESKFQSGSVTEGLSRFKAAARELNVVMISLESTAAQYLSLYGSQYDTMPNLSALARRALVFDNAYAVYPESIKGLFSIMCSEYPAFASQPEEYEKVECRSVASVLGGAGYRTAMFHSGRFGYLGMESIIRDRGYQTLEDAGDITANHNSSFGVDEPATVTRMLQWIDTLPRDQRFFLTYLPIAGHHPYASPITGPFKGSAEIDQYRNALHYGDESLGTLIEGIRARGLADNTIWIIYGDHGEAFQQHDGNYGHTFFLYEENVHVPLIVAGPGLIGGQQRVHEVVSLVDIAPTILDLAGLPIPPNYQGRTLLDGDSRMALFFADYSLGLLGLRDGRWKFVYEVGSGRTKVFDLDRDPREWTDVSDHEAARASWYTQVVRGWSAQQKSYLARR
jgi:hypothetical protein